MNCGVFGHASDWLRPREVRNRALVDELGEQLDAGESEVIAPCIEIGDTVGGSSSVRL